MAPPDPTDELAALCERLIEGTLGDEERARLGRLVLEDAGARRRYVEYMHLHAALRWQSGRLADRPLGEVIGDGGARPARRWRQGAALALMLGVGAAAGAVAVAAERAPAVATLAAAKDCRWEGGALPTEIGAKLPAGRLRLASGLAHLVFTSGAE